MIVSILYLELQMAMAWILKDPCKDNFNNHDFYQDSQVLDIILSLWDAYNKDLHMILARTVQEPQNNLT